jgi:hypothetical protein
MPKKDTATAVLGMLSNVGAQTRPTASAPAAAPVESLPATTDVAPVQADLATPVAEPASSVEVAAHSRPTATVSTLPPTPGPAKAADTAPRTLRLQPATAQALRDAWLEAKRDDVLLTAQDFASALLNEALSRRRRQQSARSG